MKRIFVSLFCFLPIFYTFAYAEHKGHGVEVRPTSAELLEIEPGKIVTASFLVSNLTGGDEEFAEELTLPAGWHKIVSDEPTFNLEAEESQVRIMALLVPLSTPAGRYQIRYAVTSQRDYGISDTDSLLAVVLPLVKLEVLIEQKPEMVVGGDPYEVRLRVLNRGNSKIDVRMTVGSTPNYPVELDTSHMILEVGESQAKRLRVQTDEKLKRRITHILEIHAQAREERNGIVSVRQTVSVEVIPKITGETDPYHRLPVKVALVLAGRDERTGFQAQVSGSGSLDEEGERNVDFLFRAPDTQDKSTYGKRDEFWISYRNERLCLHLGDRSFSLSPLTERFSYGRGVEARTSRGKFGFGGFYLQKRWQNPRARELATYLAYQFNELLGIRANFLSKTRLSSANLRGYDHEIMSVEAKVRPDETVDLDFECAFSDGNRENGSKPIAFRVSLDGRSDDIWYSFEKIYAGSDYFGYYNDVSYTNGIITFPIHSKLRGSLSYRSYRSNLDLDSTKGTANREKSYQGGVLYSFPFGTSVSFDFEDLAREDYVLPADYNYQERAWKLGLGHNFGKLNLQTHIEGGTFEDRLSENTEDDLERYSFHAFFQPNGRQTFTLWARTGHNSFTANRTKTTSWGGSTSWRIKDKISVDLNYRKEESPSGAHQGRHDLFSTLRYELPNEHTLILRSQWSEHELRGEEDFSFLVMYTVPLRVPVGKKRSVGALGGRIYDGEDPDKSPISRVVLVTQDATAITDKNGEFIFPSLSPGTYYLRVEKSSIGLNRTTTEKLPIAVEVKGGETKEIQIAVVTSCSISGRVAVFRPESEGGLGDQDTGSANSLSLVGSGEEEHLKGDNAKYGVGLGNILVVASDGKEVLRQSTDAKGNFSFDDIRPGKWRLKFHSQDLPQYHYLEEDEFEIQLEPGEKREITVRVLPRLRPIQIIEEGEIE